MVGFSNAIGGAAAYVPSCVTDGMKALAQYLKKEEKHIPDSMKHECFMDKEEQIVFKKQEGTLRKLWLAVSNFLENTFSRNAIRAQKILADANPTIKEYYKGRYTSFRHLAKNDPLRVVVEQIKKQAATLFSDGYKGNENLAQTLLTRHIVVNLENVKASVMLNKEFRGHPNVENLHEVFKSMNSWLANNTYDTKREEWISAITGEVVNPQSHLVRFFNSDTFQELSGYRVASKASKDLKTPEVLVTTREQFIALFIKLVNRNVSGDEATKEAYIKAASDSLQKVERAAAAEYDKQWNALYVNPQRESFFSRGLKAVGLQSDPTFGPMPRPKIDVAADEIERDTTAQDYLSGKVSIFV